MIFAVEIFAYKDLQIPPHTVRAGIPIRVGWSLDFDNDGKAELAHWADAMFLTEFEGEIFAQINEINRQAPLRGKRRIDLGEKPIRWTGLLGTNGFLEGRFNDDQPASQRAVKTQWCIDSRVPRSEMAFGITLSIYFKNQRVTSRL